jgi:tetratricopeptide (TPR) repeat protein
MMAMRPTTTAGSKRLKFGLIGAGVLALAAVITAGVMFWPSGEPATEGTAASAVPAPSADAVSLAILPFKNASGDQSLDWLGDGLAEMLRTDVGQSASLRTVSSDRVHQILTDLRLTPGASMEEVTLRRIAEFGNAETLVFGQFAKLGDQIRIDATVRDFERHSTVTLKAEAATENDLLEAVDGLAAEVRDSLALSRSGRRELEQQAFMPSTESIAALRHFNEGLVLLRDGNNLGAVTSFEKSVEEDPEFALANARLAQTYDTLGRGQMAVDTSRRAVELSDGLPDAERFMIVAQDAFIQGDWDAGIDAYQNLLRMHPNDPELHFELAAIYEGEGSFDQALDHLGTALEADPRNVTAQLARGRVLIKSGNSQDALAPLNQALSLAIQAGNDEAKANTLQALGVAYKILGQPEDALENYQESLAIKQEIGDRRGMASSLSEIGNIKDLQGDAEGARQSYNEAIDISREIGDDSGLALMLLRLGDLEVAGGNSDEGLAHFREALRLQIELGDEVGQSSTLTSIGSTYRQRGEYSESLIYYERALETRERLGNAVDIGDALHNLAETFTFMGRYDQAQDHYLRSLEKRRESADEFGSAVESFSLARVYSLQGRYAAALAGVEEALEIFRRLEETGSWYVEALAESGNALSLLGRFDDAGGVLDEALSAAEELGDDQLRALVLRYQGDRALFMSDLDSARRLYEASATAAGAARDPYLILAARAGTARSRLMAGEAAQLETTLDELVRSAQGRGARYLATRCTLCQSSALLATGRAGDAEPKLRSALREAENMGAAPLVAQSHFLLWQAGVDEADRHLAKAGEILEEIRTESGDGPFSRSDLAPIAEAIASN